MEAGRLPVVECLGPLGETHLVQIFRRQGMDAVVGGVKTELVVGQFFQDIHSSTGVEQLHFPGAEL